MSEEIATRNVEPTGPKVYPTCPKCGKRLQDNVCPECGYKRVVGYKIEADTDMVGHGFRKELNWREIKYDDARDQWHLLTYFFEVNKFPCHNCKTFEYSWLMAGRTGIYKTCLGCHKTTGPISREEGILLEDVIVEPEIVMSIYKARQLKPPKELQRVILSRRSRVKRRKKVSKDVETF